MTAATQVGTFHLLETTVAQVQAAMAAGEITARQLVDLYLARIEAYDKTGPSINAVINLNPRAREEADALDAAYKASGPRGPLHGIPVLLKDQMDAARLPTTLGSVLFKDYVPERDAFVTKRLREAGAIILGKTTLGELGGGDTHGTLFGSTRNPYDLERTAGGSSGGSGASASANFATITIGQEGFASIRRPSAWNSVVGMRPTPGVVSRAGSWGGGPGRTGCLGPICRTVEDLAAVMDVIAGYDADDPVTALGIGKFSLPFSAGLSKDGLKGARIGILRTPMANNSEPDSEDFKNVTAVFDQAVRELAAAGATVVDPIEIPGLVDLMARRAGEPGDAAFEAWMVRTSKRPFATEADLKATDVYQQVITRRSGGVIREATAEAHYQYLLARDELMLRVMTVMAEHGLDAIVHKTVEHTPTLIRDGVNPPFVNMKGAPHLNTFLQDVPSLSVPAGFTAAGLPVGITLLGRSFADGDLIKYAYAYEQATHHRVPPSSTPALPNEP